MVAAVATSAQWATGRTRCSPGALARVLLKHGASRGLVSFGGADNHIHAALVTDRRCAREHLPRVQRAELMAQLPAGALDGERPLDCSVLVEAAAAAFALRAIQELRARPAEVLVVRAVTLQARLRAAMVERERTGAAIVR